MFEDQIEFRLFTGKFKPEFAFKLLSLYEFCKALKQLSCRFVLLLLLLFARMNTLLELVVEFFLVELSRFINVSKEDDDAVESSEFNIMIFQFRS